MGTPRAAGRCAGGWPGGRGPGWALAARSPRKSHQPHLAGPGATRSRPEPWCRPCLGLARAAPPLIWPLPLVIFTPAPPRPALWTTSIRGDHCCLQACCRPCRPSLNSSPSFAHSSCTAVHCQSRYSLVARTRLTALSPLQALQALQACGSSWPLTPGLPAPSPAPPAAYTGRRPC